MNKKPSIHPQNPESVYNDGKECASRQSSARVYAQRRFPLAPGIVLHFPRRCNNGMDDMSRFLNAIVKLFIKTFMPGIAKSLEEEGQFDFKDKEDLSEDQQRALAFQVENNGADTTVVCFAGMAVLYAAMPKFEFRKTLTESGGKYNFIWVRDIHRASYHLAPDGTRRGYAFYVEALSQALASLPSTYHVAIGASGGGTAAFAFSGKLPIHRVIAFNPAFPLGEYGAWKNLRRVLFDMPKLLRKPGDYFETLLVTLSTRYLWRRNCRLMGEENLPDPLTCYLEKTPPARATIFYSDRCPPDTAQALGLANEPSITLKPIPSGRHNCMGELKQRGELGALIHSEIQNALP